MKGKFSSFQDSRPRAFAAWLKNNPAAELTFKYVPMAEDKKYLLKAKYPEMEFNSRKIVSDMDFKSLKEMGEEKRDLVIDMK